MIQKSSATGQIQKSAKYFGNDTFLFANDTYRSDNKMIQFW